MRQLPFCPQGGGGVIDAANCSRPLTTFQAFALPGTVRRIVKGYLRRLSATPEAQKGSCPGACSGKHKNQATRTWFPWYNCTCI